MSASSGFAAIILAAGQGTRMRSDTHKVLHPIAGRAMLLHLLDTVRQLGAERIVAVLGKGREQVEKALAGTGAQFAIQSEQKGTGHAVQQAAGRARRLRGRGAGAVRRHAVRRGSDAAADARPA